MLGGIGVLLLCGYVSISFSCLSAFHLTIIDGLDRIERTVRDGPVVCGLEESICSKGVRDSSMLWLNKTVIDGVIEALVIQTGQHYVPLVAPLCPDLPAPRQVLGIEGRRTGPVRTFADFVDHVPTSWASIAAKMGVVSNAPARSRDCKDVGAMFK